MEKRVESGLTRRSFLKTTALAAGAVSATGLAGCATIEEKPGVDLSETGAQQVEEHIYHNWCSGNCGGRQSCCIETRVRDGKVVSTRHLTHTGEGRRMQAGCVKGPTNLQRIYGTRRVMYPLLQKGERGSDNWERISWDEAIELMAGKLQAAFDEYGPQSVGFMGGGGNHDGALGSCGTGIINDVAARGKLGIGPERFVRKTGMTLFTSGGDMAQIHMEFNVLSSPANSVEDIVNAKTIFCFANPIDANRPKWNFIMEAKQKGTKLITIDPRYSNTAAHSDQWVPIRPGSDGALLLAMCNYIIDNDLIDYDYLSNQSVAPFLIKADGTYLKASDIGLEVEAQENDADADVPAWVASAETGSDVDPVVVWDDKGQQFVPAFSAVDPAVHGTFDAKGVEVRTVYDVVCETIKPFTVAFAAKECDLSEELIIDLAKQYADGPSWLFHIDGFQHYANSWRMYYTLAFMASLTGNACKPGTNYGYTLNASSPYVKPVTRNTAALEVEDAKDPTMITLSRIPEIIETGKWKGEDFPIRVLWIEGSNPIANSVGYDAQIEAYKKIDFVVVADPFMTDTALCADLVLPITMSFEEEDMSTNFNDQKAIDPIGESISDFDLFVTVAGAMGYDDLYDKDATGYLREVLDTPENLEAGCGYDAYHEQGAIITPEYTYNATVAVEYNAFGRTQFYMENPPLHDDWGQEVKLEDRMPYYEHAYEAYGDNPKREQYPLYAISCHNNYTGQSIYCNVPWLKEIRGYEGEPYTVISEAIAKDRDIATGDMIRVFNDRGSFTTRAVVSKGMHPDTIEIPRGYEHGELVEGHPQALTAVEAVDWFSSNDSHNDYLCQVEKL